MGVTVVNDGVSQLKNAKIVVNQYAWSKGFEPVYNENQTMDISALSAQNVNFNGSVYILAKSKDMRILFENLQNPCSFNFLN